MTARVLGWLIVPAIFVALGWWWGIACYLCLEVGYWCGFANGRHHGRA
jgi:hypothetical protein